MTMNENKQVEPVAVDHSGLIKRIDAAIERVTKGYGLMTIPADPRSDVDLVLSECKALLQGEKPPFWAKDFHPTQAVVANEKMYNALKMVMDDPQSLEGRPRTFECVTEAIAAYEAARKGGAA